MKNIYYLCSAKTYRGAFGSVKKLTTFAPT